jgi:ATP-binding cassette subfamily B protein
LQRTLRAARRMLKSYPLTLRLVWDASPGLTTLNAALIVVQAAVAPAQVWLLKTVIDRIIAAVQVAAQNQALDWSAVLLPVGAMLAIRLVEALVQSLLESAQGLLQRKTEVRTRYLILEKASQLDIAFFQTPSFHDLLRNSLEQSWRARHLAFVVLRLTGQVLSMGAILGLLLRLQPIAVLVLLVTTLPHILVQSYYANKQFVMANAWTPTHRKLTYLSYGLLTWHEDAPEVRLFGLADLFLGRFRRIWDQLLDEEKALSLSRARATLLLALLSTLGVVAVWVHAVTQAVWSIITIGDLALVFDVTRRVQDGFRWLFDLVGTFYSHTLFLTNLVEFLELPPDAVDGALSRPIEPDRQLSVHPVFRQGIEFRNVSFRYPGSEKHALQDVSFVLRPGETVALVGENGAGKTTLVKLLSRLYDPTEGTILLDGQDLRAYDLDAYRRQLGVILQDFLQYHLSVRENIGLGQVDLMDDQERIERAAELGGARAMIDSLPQGFDTQLGTEFEGGVDLSTGQWQKLALSRAFMRDAQVLILDEPTAALDAKAEHDVYQRFTRLTAGKATVLVTHRLWTVKMADRILLLEQGQLVEEGTHDELMALDGRYAQMYALQADKYESTPPPDSATVPGLTTSE